MIEKNFRLEVDRYVTMDFGVFSYAIDQIGGIDIELTAQEAQAFAAAAPPAPIIWTARRLWPIPASGT